MSGNGKLRKSEQKIIAGVAGGMANFFGWRPEKVRTLWFLAGFFTGGAALIAYGICAYVFPPPNDFNLDDFRVQ